MVVRKEIGVLSTKFLVTDHCHEARGSNSTKCAFSLEKSEKFMRVTAVSKEVIIFLSIAEVEFLGGKNKE